MKRRLESNSSSESTETPSSGSPERAGHRIITITDWESPPIIHPRIQKPKPPMGRPRTTKPESTELNVVLLCAQFERLSVSTNSADEEDEGAGSLSANAMANRFALLLSSLKNDIDEIILDLDVNGTIIAEDRAGGETVDQFIEKLIARERKEGRNVDEDVLSAIKKKLATREDEATLFIFPSLFRLFDQLDAAQMRYKVRFRTFGTDIPDIITGIKSKRPGVEFAHIDFMQPNYDASTQRQILATEHLGMQWITVQENYAFWNTNGRNAQSGKQLCLNEDPRVLNVFLDDCIGRKSLIHVTSNGNTIETTEAIKRGHLVPVNTLDAMYNDDYFVEQLLNAYARYADSLQLEGLAPLFNRRPSQ